MFKKRPKVMIEAEKSNAAHACDGRSPCLGATAPRWCGVFEAVGACLGPQIIFLNVRLATGCFGRAKRMRRAGACRYLLCAERIMRS